MLHVTTITGNALSAIAVSIALAEPCETLLENSASILKSSR
ncbi:MAG: hypothetical protein RM338_10865 [Nostoc sp. DedQUE12a]|nr:hypothetical protein [Nostoc sp. DedQUE12a]